MLLLKHEDTVVPQEMCAADTSRMSRSRGCEEKMIQGVCSSRGTSIEIPLFYKVLQIFLIFAFCEW